MINRFILLVLDSAGIGALPDAATYGDEGANTLGHIFEAMGGGFELPHLASLGLYHALPAGLRPLPGVLEGAWGKMACASRAKDTTVGHWEIAGLILSTPFPTYPHGFPKDVITEFEQRIGTHILGNCTASGTEIIKQLGDEHCRTGYPIVYTSADSVFQIAAHEETFGLQRLYDICRTAREMLVGEHAVGRVIARPFIGSAGNYTRTPDRRDFALSPFKPTILDGVKKAGGSVVAIGKIEDIFNKQGITQAVHTHNNGEGIAATLDALRSHQPGKTIIFTNLVDFDMLWGHRRDVKGYADGLRAADRSLPDICAAMRDDDILIVTADHGCDPTWSRHTDHTREYVPLLVYGKAVKAGAELGTRTTFADIAQTIADAFGLPLMENGISFRKAITG